MGNRRTRRSGLRLAHADELSCRRAIDFLPATSTGAAKLAARTSGAYGRVRVQFKTPIGHFEGVEEALSRIGGNTYMMDAARMMTAGAVDLGEKPSVISAIVKYHLTERGRQAINDAMDVHGGKGICLGPSNYLGRNYQHIPVSITVEGANILTRNMIIFGQGAIRCHPYLLKEIRAASNGDTVRASVEFDKALMGTHCLYSVGNGLRSLLHGLTGGISCSAPGSVGPEVQGYYSQLTRFSAAFAFLADISLLVLGGALKRKERLSARLGDILSMLYLCSAALKRFKDDGGPQLIYRCCIGRFRMHFIACSRHLMACWIIFPAVFSRRASCGLWCFRWASHSRRPRMNWGTNRQADAGTGRGARPPDCGYLYAHIRRRTAGHAGTGASVRGRVRSSGNQVTCGGQSGPDSRSGR